MHQVAYKAPDTLADTPFGLATSRYQPLADKTPGTLVGSRYGPATGIYQPLADKTPDTLVDSPYARGHWQTQAIGRQITDQAHLMTGH
jgi:hypothetical protein